MQNSRGDFDPPSFFRNEWFYFVARICMIGASVIGLPTASFLLTRIVHQADEISLQVAQQNLTLQLLREKTEYRLDNTDRILVDHEQRIRIIERR